MSENVYNLEISEWYDAIMDAGYNPSDHKTAADTIVRILGSRRKVVELGTGTGLLAEHLIEDGIDFSGFDFSESMLAKAAKRLGSVKLYQQDVLDLDLPEKYEAAVSQGGVWVANRTGSLVSHLTGYQRNLQGLTRVAQHLDPNGLLILNLGPEQKNLTLVLAGGAEYSQKITLKDETFEKEYFVRKDGEVVAHQRCVYGRISPEQTSKMMGEAGFRSLGPDKSDRFLVFQKKD